MFKKLIYCIGMCFFSSIYAGLFGNNNKTLSLPVICKYYVDEANTDIFQLDSVGGGKKLSIRFDTNINNGDIGPLKDKSKACEENNSLLLNDGLAILSMLLNKSKINDYFKNLILKTIKNGPDICKDGSLRLEKAYLALVKNKKVIPIDELLTVDANAGVYVCLLFYYKQDDSNFADNMQDVVSKTSPQTASSTSVDNKTTTSLTHNQEINMHDNTPKSTLFNDDNNTHGPIIIPNIMLHTPDNLRTNDDSGQHNHQTLPGKHIPGSVKKGVNSESNTGGCCKCKTR